MPLLIPSRSKRPLSTQRERQSSTQHQDVVNTKVSHSIPSLLPSFPPSIPPSLHPSLSLLFPLIEPSNHSTLPYPTPFPPGMYPSLPIHSLLDLGKAVNFMDATCPQIPKDKPWFSIVAEDYDAESLASWCNKNMWTSEAKEVVEMATRGLLGAETNEISLLSWLWYAHSGHNLTYLTETSEGAQKEFFVGGSQQLSEGLAEQLSNGSIVMNSPVEAITQDQDNEVVMVTANGVTFTARRCVLAISPSLAAGIEYEPRMPAIRDQLTRRMPMGSIIKTITFYNTPFWKDSGYCGIVGDSQGPVCATYDDSDYELGSYAIMGFIGGDQARQMSEMSMEERRDAVCKQYAKLFNTQEALSCLDYIDQNWLAEKYSGGCYTSLLPPGVLTQLGSALREPVGLIHFAGTETASEFSGYMEGALQSGERCAHEVDVVLKTGDMPDLVLEKLTATKTVDITPSKVFNTIDFIMLIIFWLFALSLFLGALTGQIPNALPPWLQEFMGNGNGN
eukprot:TRINITY_DN153_c1_g1_i4.p1 TRINITY_DN153_c1_g1~~TRINITY_DN153_c1_g1_i4.p1  ORF type:complete len:505 (+),score=105.69 TRINITY_DN153_c1_g1_i4:344-1858(+)